MEKRICKFTNREFTITKQEKKAYERFGMPLPDIYPDERHRYHFSYSNPLTLYWAKEVRTGKKILSGFDPTDHPTIYDGSFWMSADFDAREYGRDFDFSRPFFDQWKELFDAVPKPALTMLRTEDCDYSNYLADCKRCYLTFNALGAENLLYSVRAFFSKDSIELFNLTMCELSYGCIHCLKCYNVKFADFATNCVDSAFLYDCDSCSNCYQCANLKHKSYCIQNKQYTKEEYQEKMKNIDLSSYKTWRAENKKWQTFLQKEPIRAERLVNCQDSDGILLTNCRNCHRCFTMVEGDNNYNSFGQQVTDSCDADGWNGSASLLRTTAALSSRDIYFSWGGENSYSIGYSYIMMNSHDCFGCYGVKNGAYCLLNKEYTQKEYKKILPKVIAHMKKTGEWGQWFPHSMSPYYYDETDASLIFSVTGEEAKRMGLRMRKQKRREKSEGSPVSKIPDRVADFKKADLKKSFLCEETDRAYKITKEELAMHKQLGVPLPRVSWQARLAEHYPKAYPLPHETTCAHCGKSIYSFLDPKKTTRPLWCDACYLQKYS